MAITINIEELSDEINKAVNRNYDVNAVNREILNNIRTLMFKLFEELIKTTKDLEKVREEDPAYKEIYKAQVKLYSAVKSLLHKYSSEISAVKPVYGITETQQQQQA